VGEYGRTSIGGGEKTKRKTENTQKDIGQKQKTKLPGSQREQNNEEGKGEA